MWVVWAFYRICLNYEFPVVLDPCRRKLHHCSQSWAHDIQIKVRRQLRTLNCRTERLEANNVVICNSVKARKGLQTTKKVEQVLQEVSCTCVHFYAALTWSLLGTWFTFHLTFSATFLAAVGSIGSALYGPHYRSSDISEIDTARAGKRASSSDLSLSCSISLAFRLCNKDTIGLGVLDLRHRNWISRFPSLEHV